MVHILDRGLRRREGLGGNDFKKGFGIFRNFCHENTWSVPYFKIPLVCLKSRVNNTTGRRDKGFEKAYRYTIIIILYLAHIQTSLIWKILGCVNQLRKMNNVEIRHTYGGRDCEGNFWLTHRSKIFYVLSFLLLINTEICKFVNDEIWPVWINNKTKQMKKN